MRSYLLAGLMAATVAGCGMFKGDPSAEQLASGCQIIKCVCLQASGGIMLPSLKKREVNPPLWRDNGTAYCPEGYRLERAQERSVYDRPLY